MKKKGITLAILVVTIIIIMLLVSAILVSYNGIKESTRKKEFGKEIYMIQNLAEKYYFENEVYPVKGTKEFSLDTMDLVDRTQFLNEPGYDSNLIEFEILDLYELGVENVTRGTMSNSDANDIYVISKTTGKVFYLKGEKIGDKVFYTLNEELKKEIGLMG